MTATAASSPPRARPVDKCRGERPPRRSALERAALVALTLAAAIAALLTAAHPAAAHPLGNFSVNHVSTVSISGDRVDVRYVLDQAEIPTVQEEGPAAAALLARKRDEVRRGLELTVDGRRVPLVLDGPGRVSFPRGSGGLKTSRFELELSASVDSPRSVRFHDGTFPDRVGWKAVVVAPGEGTAVRTRTPSDDPTNELRRYPDELLNSPLDERDASFAVSPGAGTLVAPRSEGKPLAATDNGESGFAGLFEDAAAGEGVLVLLLLAALGWGALHALSPGHGKAMVAAYLVGTRGTARHAVALGATVTVAHTIGVFALGFVTLALSQYVLPEDLYPWLNLVAGLLVVTIGAGVRRARIRGARGGEAHAGHAHGGHAHAGHAHAGHAHAGHAHTHAGHAHAHAHGSGHVHTHAAGLRPPAGGAGAPDAPAVSRRSILGLGAAAGMIPCPSALVVLLAAISQHEVALGLLLIVAFSLGLAGTLTVLGLAVVYAGRLLPRFAASRRGLTARLVAALPAASAVVIVGVGFVLTANALPALM